MSYRVDSLSIVLPLKIDSNTYGNDLLRLTRVLLPSLVKFFNVDQIREMLIIAPAQECAPIRVAVEPFISRIRCRVVAEEKLLQLSAGWKRHCAYIGVSSLLRKYKKTPWARFFLRRMGSRKTWRQMSGWYRQQVFKLCAAILVKTDFYLTCDADLCLTRQTDCSVLFPGGKAIVSREKINMHVEWWNASARLLKCAMNLGPDDTGMCVTPELLCTKVVRDLLKHLKINGTQQGYPTIFDYLANHNDWTEYTLYWLYLLHRRLEGHIYSMVKDSVSLIDIENSIWHGSCVSSKGALEAAIEKTFGNSRSLFMVVQNNSVEARDYASAVEKFLH